MAEGDLDYNGPKIIVSFADSSPGNIRIHVDTVTDSAGLRELSRLCLIIANSENGE